MFLTNQIFDKVMQRNWLCNNSVKRALKTMCVCLKVLFEMSTSITKCIDELKN